jgi:hypothetical protein
MAMAGRGVSQAKYDVASNCGQDNSCYRSTANIADSRPAAPSAIPTSTIAHARSLRLPKHDLKRALYDERISTWSFSAEQRQLNIWTTGFSEVVVHEPCRDLYGLEDVF